MQIQPLKRSLSGLEIEVQTLDNKGHIVPEADKIIADCKRENPDIHITTECSKNMIELGSFPSVNVRNTTLDLLNNLQTVLGVADKHDIVIYPLSVYPGRFIPVMRKKEWYSIQETIFFGKGKFIMAGKTPAFHYHYALPRGIFDYKKRFLKPLINSKVKKTLIDSFNLAISMDPALITMFQSSPLLDGKYVSKDCRILMQRTGKFFPFKGIYHKNPRFAGLPIYKETVTDLIHSIKDRYELVKEILLKHGLDPLLANKFGRVLDYSWHSVRINKKGTIEQRTMDMNHPKYVVAGTILLKYIYRRIQQDFLQVVPSDIGIEEPFKQEGNVLYIPPHTHVRKKLQNLSVYEGFENKEVFNYTKRMLNFGKRCTPKKFYDSLRPLHRMIERKKSVSDVLMDKYKKLGYGKDDKIPNDVCARVALSSSSQLYREIEETKKKIEDLD